jgi:hypothetical protein
MCVEWLKLNPDGAHVPSSASSAPARTSLAERARREVDRVHPPPVPPKAQHEVEPKLDPIAPALLNALTPERVEHLKRERIEMLVTLDDAGDVLLSPEPTTPDALDEFERLTYDDALAIASVAVQFPGARLKRVRKPRKARQP